MDVFRREPQPIKSRGVPINSVLFAALWALIFVVFYNTAFFDSVNQTVNSFSASGGLFTASLALLLWSITFIFLNLIVIPYVVRPLFILLIIGAAATSYFMNTYGVVIHKLMIQNVVETDVGEVSGLLSFTLIGYLFVLGVIPLLLLFRTRVVYATPVREIFNKLKALGVALLIIVSLIAGMSAQYSSFFREHKDIRQRANPLNFVYASIAYFSASNAPKVVASIGTDAKLNESALAQKKPVLLVVVVGETARADRFAINGYERDTNPQLTQKNIINYNNVFSCGTETAVSVPCMFSLLDRKNYSDKKAKSQESVLDVFKHAGIPVYWRDNNSSCKGACDRVEYENVQEWKIPELCNDKECFDNVLLHELDKKLEQLTGGSPRSSVIVLHQKGTHGPDYYHRYPESAEFFVPACHTNQLQDCSEDELNNAYDNTIRYTDQFLAKTIDWLAANESTYNTAMVYLSDHGESLGENGLYLHGMPYMIAPKEQKHIPFFFWFSAGFEQDAGLQRDCLISNTHNEYSQDNLFHTLLGLMGVSTQVYQAELDMVQGCRK